MAARSIYVLLALLATTATAAADPAFGWSAPAGCPRAEEVRARVERRLGRPIEGAVHGVEIEITREGSGFVARVDARALTVANDVRTLRSARCGELADAIALILVRLATEARSAPPPPPAPELASPAAPREVARLDDDVRSPETEPATSIHVPAPAAAPTRRWAGGGRVLGLSGIGALPGVNLGVELAGYLRRDERFVELAVARWVPQSARFDPGAPARVDVSLDLVTMRVGWATEALPIRGWLLGEVGSLRGSGMDLIDPKVVTAPWYALGAGFGVAWPMSPRSRLVGTFEVAFPLQRPTFALQGGNALFEPAAAAARCAFGLELGWR